MPVILQACQIGMHAMHGSVMICVEMGADGYCALSSVFKIHLESVYDKPW